MEYTNPFAGLPETNLPNNPFWSGVNQGQRQQINNLSWTWQDKDKKLGYKIKCNNNKNLCLQKQWGLGNLVLLSRHPKISLILQKQLLILKLFHLKHN